MILLVILLWRIECRQSRLSFIAIFLLIFSCYVLCFIISYIMLDMIKCILLWIFGMKQAKFHLISAVCLKSRGKNIGEVLSWFIEDFLIKTLFQCKIFNGHRLNLAHCKLTCLLHVWWGRRNVFMYVYNSIFKCYCNKTHMRLVQIVWIIIGNCVRYNIIILLFLLLRL